MEYINFLYKKNKFNINKIIRQFITNTCINFYLVKVENKYKLN